jgi:hypothetical protein
MISRCLNRQRWRRFRADGDADGDADSEADSEMLLIVTRMR